MRDADTYTALAVEKTTIDRDVCFARRRGHDRRRKRRLADADNQANGKARPRSRAATRRNPRPGSSRPDAGRAMERALGRSARGRKAMAAHPAMPPLRNP